MLFSKTIFAAAAALVTAVTAQNAFTLPAIGSITAGQSFTITWTPTTGATDTVTLLLVQDQGNSAALVTVATITSTAPNSGTFVWNVPTSVTKGSQYAFEIISNTNKNLSNFSDRFAIDSTNTITSRASTSGSSTGTSSSSASTSSSSSTSASTTSTTSGSITTSKSATDSSKTSSSATTTSGNSTSGSSASVGSATTSPTSKSSTAAGATGVKVGSGLVGAVLGGLAMVL